jgi:probable rRNA maturation factor
VEISNDQNDIRVPRKRIRRLVALMDRLERPIAHVDIAFVDCPTITEHNIRFLGHRGKTDVISFDLSDEPDQPLVAQLLICGPVAREQAEAHGEGVTREVLRYVAHGLLHQMGYDDQDPRQAQRMHAREDQLLDKLANQE